MEVNESQQVEQISRLKTLIEVNEHSLEQMKATLADLESRLNTSDSENAAARRNSFGA